MPKHEALPVVGYREQTHDAIAAVNMNKAIEEQTLRLLDYHANDPNVDKRWLAIGRTQIEQGFMAVNCAVFKPSRATLAEDAV